MEITVADDAPVFTAPHFTLTKIGLPKCSHLMNYGLGCDEAESLWVRAGACCEICRLPEAQTPHGRLFIDHNPYMGYNAVRGLLCVDCNRRLDDYRLWPWSAEYAYAAAHYLANVWHAQPGAQPVVRVKPKIGIIRRNFRFGVNGTDAVIHNTWSWGASDATAHCGTRVYMPFWSNSADGYTRCEQCPEQMAELVAHEVQQRDERIKSLRVEIKELRNELRDELAAQKRAASHALPSTEEV